MTILDSLIQTTKDLCAIPSVYPDHEAKKEALLFITNWLDLASIPYKIYDHTESPSCIARLDGEGEPIILLAHIDVVPAPNFMFAVKQEGNMLYGRGVQDDKGPAVILLHVLKYMLAKENRPTIEVVFTTDEERGSADGVKRLVEMGVFTSPRFVLALDGGTENEVIIAEKGVVHVNLKAQGKSAHNSMPWIGDNAIDKLITSYLNIKKALCTTTRDDNWNATVSIGKIEGGQFVNQVPEFAQAEIDIRFTAEHDTTSIIKIVNSCLESGVEMTRSASGEPFESNKNNPLICAYVSAMESVTDSSIHLGVMHGATDGRFFTKYNCPIILHYPDGGEIHTDNEWVNADSMKRIYDGLIKFLTSL